MTIIISKVTGTKEWTKMTRKVEVGESYIGESQPFGNIIV